MDVSRLKALGSTAMIGLENGFANAYRWFFRALQKQALELRQADGRGVMPEWMLELIERPVAGSYDLAHLKAIHRHLFQDVYDWAGELRTVN